MHNRNLVPILALTLLAGIVSSYASAEVSLGKDYLLEVGLRIAEKGYS